MFLYFLQKKGALDRNPRFITSWYDQAIKTNNNYYRYVLEELFFQTLNRPRADNQHVRFRQGPLSEWRTFRSG